MNNIAVIFAGGTGQRMNTKTLPKQFLELHGKPILIYTLEHFEKHNDIDAFIVVCVKEWMDYCSNLIEKFGFSKIAALVAGGSTGQESIFNGLQTAVEKYPLDSVVLIHDGVRPLIDEDIISCSIASVKQYGSAIAVSPAIETVTISDGDSNLVSEIVDRSKCRMAKAPQSFYLKDLYESHLQARKENLVHFIDSASLMLHYGYKLHTITCSSQNIKITTPSDFYIFRAMIDAKENSQIFGI